MTQLIQFATVHPWLVTLLAAAAVAVLAYELRSRLLSVGAISPQDVVRLMNQGAPVLDLRPAEVFASGHLSNARNLPADRLGEAVDTLKRYKDRPVIVVCERGTRTPGAIRQLTALGFSKLFSLRGGIHAWRAENLPLVRS